MEKNKKEILGNSEESHKEYDFWSDTLTWLKTQLDDNFKQNVIDHCIKENFTTNERHLFRSMLEKSIDFEAMMAILTIQIDEQEELKNSSIEKNKK